MNFFLYFFLGLVIDVLATFDSQAVIDRKPLVSAACSFSLTMIHILVIANIVLSADALPLAFAYAFGGAVGSWWAVQRKRGA